MNKLKEIGRRIAALRTQKGLTQEALADIVGVSRSTIAGIETGGDRGGALTMIAIADHFKVPMDWLFCRTIPAGGPLTGHFVDQADELAWLDFWRQLDDADRAATLRLLRVPMPDKSVA